MTFGQLVRRHRQARGWSQRVLAARAHLALGYVCELELDNRQPGRPSVEALGRALRLRAGDRDALLIAAGYAPEWLGAAVDDPQLLYALWWLAGEGRGRRSA